MGARPCTTGVSWLLSHLRRLRADQEGTPNLRTPADAPRATPGGWHTGQLFVERRFHRRVPGRQSQSALGHQADGRIPLGADGDMQELSRYGAPAEDAMAVQEERREQACSLSDGTQRRPDWSPLRSRCECSCTRWQCRSETRARQADWRGTMSRAGARCVCCGLPSMSMEDIRTESNAGRSGLQLIAVVTEGGRSKDYRQATADRAQRTRWAMPKRPQPQQLGLLTV